MVRKVVWTHKGVQTEVYMHWSHQSHYQLLSGPGIDYYMFHLRLLHWTAREVFLSTFTKYACSGGSAMAPQGFLDKAQACGRNFRKGLLHQAARFSDHLSFTASPGTQNWQDGCIRWNICHSKNFPLSPIYPWLCTYHSAQNIHPYLSK